jgi:hypothetical protein
MFASQRLELEYVASDRSGNVARVTREVVVGANVLPPAGMALQLVLTGPRAVEPRTVGQALRLAYGPAGRFAVVVLEGNTTVERVPFGLRNASSLEWIAAAHVLAALPLSPQQLAVLGAVRVEAMATPSPAASTPSETIAHGEVLLWGGVALAVLIAAVGIPMWRGRRGRWMDRVAAAEGAEASPPHGDVGNDRSHAGLAVYDVPQLKAYPAGPAADLHRLQLGLYDTPVLSLTKVVDHDFALLDVDEEDATWQGDRGSTAI